MLTPEYLASCTDYLLGLYDQLQTSIARDIAKRLIKTGKITPTSAYQSQRAQASGKVLEEVTQEVAAISGYSADEIARLFEEAGVTAIKNDVQPLLKAGIKVDMSLSPDMRQVLEASIAKTSGDVKNLTMTTATMAMQQYIDASNLAYLKVVSGGYSYQQAIAQAIRDAASAGSFVTFTGGGKSRLDAAIRRSVLTGVNQTCGKITEANAQNLDAEYYEVSAHSGARPSHAEWQGGVYKINGSTTDYPNFAETTGYGTGEGLCGWNCRHSFYPFWPGISVRAYTKEKLDWYNAERFEYNGQKLTDYECSQIQRSYERDIRESKRILASYDEAAKASTDEATEAAIKEEFQAESVKLKAKEAKLKDFCSQTNRTVDSARTQVVSYKDTSGKVVSFGRSTAQKAVHANKKSLFTTALPASTIKAESADIVQSIVDSPKALASYTPATLKKALENAGYEVKPLSRGSLKAIPFENGGGYKVNFGKDGIIQYHPASRSHHNGEYYKISTSEKGTRRYEPDGSEKPAGSAEHTKQNN